ncbi:LRR receptor-like serine/threonine-protein kinase GSO1 [Impatiens glandulifera]|uniref:LRR receptor-like serine/threonine-protein kinase GSO1 n=1 Tax=Impatiens glandulifera TaxID=253017 RepID=UPI001FB108AB|nr:LRR receptor-like serine/threonine-protein kinase GSO1 [Impatiens glandulifera]
MAGLFFFFFSLYTFLFLLFFPSISSSSSSSSQLSILLKIKSFLDPHDLHLNSWSADNDPCGGSFEGVACDDQGSVANISLQGKGLSGQIPPEIGQLKSLSGLYLHFNHLTGVLPREIAELTQLSDLYLNFNNLSGEIPPEIGHMTNLQVLQLCYNKLTGRLPIELGSLNKLDVLSLQFNNFTGAIPASWGDLTLLKRLDLSFNSLFGSIPVMIANLPILQFLDVRNNSLSGKVPIALKRLNDGFQFKNNKGLCGIEFSSLLEPCNASINDNKPEPFGFGDFHSKEIPESANVHSNCTHRIQCSHKQDSNQREYVIIAGSLATVIVVATVLITFSCYRRKKQKISSVLQPSDPHRLSTNDSANISPLINLEYPKWDPILSKESSSSFGFTYNVEDVESATQHFSEANLLGSSRTGSSSLSRYKGILRDGSLVEVKCISKSSCKADESEFLKGLKLMTTLEHDNILRFRGFCCSSGRHECFLLHDFVPNGNLLQYLDVKKNVNNGSKVLDWSTRISIVLGLAKGIRYLHGNKKKGGNEPALVHENISADNVLLDASYKPLISGAGLHKLLADDVIYSAIKASAGMGYLAPEYATFGRLTVMSDVYAFGVIVLQILSGKRKITHVNRRGVDSCVFDDFVDGKLGGEFSEKEAVEVGKIAVLCMHESPESRPDMETVVQNLSDICIC